MKVSVIVILSVKVVKLLVIFFLFKEVLMVCFLIMVIGVVSEFVCNSRVSCCVFFIEFVFVI